MFKIGQSLGDYAVLQELGKGGFGRVYKVEHTITGRREAMKVLAASTAKEAEQSERFLREIRLQASLSHPNIAVVHTAFWVNDDLALICELLEGQSLRELLEGGQLPGERALEIIAQVLDALSYAHARGIVHRDISPANIFVTAGGSVKIIDFGLAKAATDLRLTREGAPMGAAHYMSPEQIRGALDIDARTDIYSCGVVLYELVAGKKPFEGDSAFSIMKAHTEEPPPSPRAANPQIPAELSAIILRALAKKPEERFQSADAFLQAVKQVQTEPAEGKARGYPKHIALVAATVVLIILIGISALVAGRKTPLGAQSQTTQSAVAAPPPAVATATPALPAEAAKTARNTSPAAIAESVNPQETGTPDSSPDPTDAPSQAKSRNPVKKLGGVLKRAFQHHGSTHKDDTGK